MRKTKLRIKLLLAFSIVPVLSLLCTGIIFNVAVRFRMNEMDNPFFSQYMYHYEAPGVLGRAGLLLFILTGMMVVVSLVVTYFLANSITKPIEKLGKFALNMGCGDFSTNDFKFSEAELEDLNIALNNSARQLSVYDNEQKTFFQNASHELRTPLMSIKCYAEGINFGIMEPKQASETILQETDKLSQLVTDILYLSKLDNITSSHIMEEVNLTALVQDCVARQEAVAAKKGVHFKPELEKVPPYRCSAELISRVVDNLISNAVRYAASQVVIACAVKAGQIELTVTDDGEGIEPDILPQVFERFCKGKGGNHGIGLAIVKSAVAQHGGTVKAENMEKGGAKFTVQLPM